MTLTTFRTINLRGITFAGALLLGSCGGTSSNPPTVNPPIVGSPPTSAAPKVVVTSNSLTPDEGQTFTLDARSSTDPNGKALTYTVSQTAGVVARAVDVKNADNGLFTFEVPEVTNTQTLAFDLTASNGTDTSTARIDITATNIVLSPLFTNRGGATLKTGDSIAEPHTVNTRFKIPGGYRVKDGNITETNIQTGPFPTNSGTIGAEIEVIYRKTAGRAKSSFDTGIPPEDDYTLELTSADSGLPFLGEAANNDNFGFVSTHFRTNSVDIWLTKDMPEFYKSQSMEIDNVCNVKRFPAEYTHPDSYYSGNASNLADLVVGLKEGGIEVYPRRVKLAETTAVTGRDYYRYDEEPSYKLVDTGRYCHLTKYASGLIGIDSENGTLSMWSPPESKQVHSIDDRAEQVIESLDLGIAKGLEIVAVKSGTDLIYSPNGEAVSQNYIMIAVSNGKHDGDHRLITYFSDASRPTAADRQEFSWTKGVPTDIILTPLRTRFAGNQATPDIVVTSADLPYLIVIENEDIVYEDGSYSFYSTPRYIEAELGIEKLAGGRFMIPSDDKSIVIIQP